MGFFQRLFGGKKGKEAVEEPSLNAQPETLEALPVDLSESVSETQARPQQTRPLAPPKEFEDKRQRVLYGQASDVGQVRSNNQDACMSLVMNADMTGEPPSLGFFVVADGMGGHHDGELASAVTVRTLSQYAVQEVMLPILEDRDGSSDQKTIPEALSDAMNAANQSVQLQVPNGGTTATCVVVRGDLAFIAHVGDSRAYLIADGNMELITRDHSLVRRLQELGQLTAEEAEVHPQRNVLYRAIGQGETVEIDSATRRLPPASRLLLCSDGLWGVIGDERMSDILDKHSDPQKACDQMVVEANENGGPDNITAVLVQMPE